MFGPLVEFYITVTNQHGQPCQQRCLNRKGSYGICEDGPIRLSSHEFNIFSDPIEFYEVMFNDFSRPMFLYRISSQVIRQI